MVETTPNTHSFVFHGKGGEFFAICLVNLLLTMVTLGIYLPWAFAKTRRYLYENTELNGVRFAYHVTGGALFTSLLSLMALFFATSLLFSAINPALAFAPPLLFTLLMPLLVVNGLRYQTKMTSLNNVRFGFSCPPAQAYWVLLGLPLLLLVALGVVVVVLNKMMGMPSHLDGIILRAEVNVVVVALGLGAIGGMTSGKWMRLVGKHAQYGQHRFDVAVSVKRCVMSCILGVIIMLPFIFVIIKLLSPLYTSLIFVAAMGIMDSASLIDIIAGYQTQVTVAYFLYFAGGILSSLFLYTSLRNIFINGLTLGTTLKFSSRLTYIGVVMQILLLVVVSGVTFGLALPWAQMRYCRFLAQHTAVIGDLDALVLTADDEQPESGIITLLSRAVMPGLPFI